MALAKAGGKRRRAAKKAAETKIGGKKYVTPVAKKKAAAKKKVTPKRKTSVSAATRKPHRTDAQRASDKKKFLATQKTLRKESAGMRHGSEYKGPPKLSKKDQDAMARSMELGSGGGLVKAGIGAGLTALGLKGHKMYKAKKAKDLASGKTGGTSAGISKTRAASAASRTSGLGKAKTPKKKTVKRKSGPSKFLSNILKKAADYGKPKSAFRKLKKTQRRMPK